MAKETRQYGSTRATGTVDTSPPPTADEVDRFHTNSDADSRAESQHHTLGPNGSQASPGDHTHDGGDSQLLLSGLTITGSRGGNTSLPSIIAALVRLGAQDSSTA